MKKRIDSPSSTAPIFIHGMTQRSGSNFTWQLLLKHPDCHPGSVGEDYLLKNAHLLNQYCAKLFENWTPEWRDRFENSSATILSSIGSCLVELISRPYYLLSSFDKKESKHLDPGNEKNPNGRLVTKTPNVDNLDLFFKLFPDAYLVIIMRDGRSVVESGMKSFGWDFESATRRWKEAANKIIEFKEIHSDTNKRFLVVNFEKLIGDGESEVKKLLTFLNLSVSRYDIKMVNTLPVYGSSEIKDTEASIHWQPVPKDKNFEPTRRWSSWNEKMHSRFNWIAGKTMTKAGYSLHQANTKKLSSLAINIYLDTKYRFKSLLKNAKYRFKNSFKKMTM